MRLLITGHDAAGKAVFSHAGPPPRSSYPGNIVNRPLKRGRSIVSYMSEPWWGYTTVKHHWRGQTVGRWHAHRGFDHG